MRRREFIAALGGAAHELSAGGVYLTVNRRDGINN